MNTEVIEHDPHVGADYEGGLDGKKVILLGYSHWGKPDRKSFTEEAIRNVISGSWPDLAFFNQITSYFGRDHELWKDVIFMNFLPNSIGEEGRRYAWGSSDDHRRGRERLLRVMEHHQPDMVFVFSRKSWKEMPHTLEDDREESGTQIIAGQAFDRHHYRLNSGKIVQAFGLRHPQYATKDIMVDAVSTALSMERAPPPRQDRVG